MIVKNEAHVIARCLDSVRPFIDHWMLVDTGSTDGTQEVVQRCLADLPGQLLQRPWVNFAHNRTEALEAAREKAFYSFVIDADEILVIEPNFIRPRLEADGYQMKLQSGKLIYWRTQLVANRLPWRYVGVLHEKLDCEVEHETTKLRGVSIYCYREGARSLDPLTYKKTR